VKSIYRQFTDQVAADAARAAPSDPDSMAFAWLSGTWSWREANLEFAGAPYGLSCDGQPFLIYNAAAAMWLLVILDPGAFGILIGQAMRDGATRFSGEITIGGKPVQLRQFWTVRPDKAIEILSERKIDGRWNHWDRSLLRRVTRLTESASHEKRELRKTLPPTP
jgi:hypothetical protein